MSQPNHPSDPWANTPTGPAYSPLPACPAYPSYVKTACGQGEKLAPALAYPELNTTYRMTHTLTFG